MSTDGMSSLEIIAAGDRVRVIADASRRRVVYLVLVPGSGTTWRKIMTTGSRREAIAFCQGRCSLDDELRDRGHEIREALETITDELGPWAGDHDWPDALIQSLDAITAHADELAPARKG